MKNIIITFVLLFTSQSFATTKLSDVDNSDYKEAIYFLFGEGVIGGYEDGTFRPNENINRAEFLKIIIQSRYGKELEKRNYNKRCFDDIKDKNAWYVPYACFAQDWGLISGYDGKYLKPSKDINLVEAAKIISKIYGKNKININDSEIWYRPYMKYMLENRLVPEQIKTFNHKLTRGDMAEIITRADKQRFGKLQGYLDYRKEHYNEDYFPLWDEFNNNALGKETTKKVGEGTVPQKIIEIVNTPHPGEEISGNYISNYNQWIPAPYKPNINNNSLNDEEEESLRIALLSLVNTERIKNIKNKLISHTTLNQVAQNFAEHLTVNAIYSHTDKYGNDPFERVKKAGYKGFVAESMVWNKSGVLDAIAWWQNSSLHWNNIMNSRYNHAGIGVVKEPTGGYLFVLLTGE